MISEKMPLRFLENTYIPASVSKAHIRMWANKASPIQITLDIEAESSCAESPDARN